MNHNRKADVGSAIELSERISGSVSGGSLRLCLFFCLRLSVTMCSLQKNDGMFIASQCPSNEADYRQSTDKTTGNKNIAPSFCHSSFC